MQGYCLYRPDPPPLSLPPPWGPTCLQRLQGMSPLFCHPPKVAIDPKDTSCFLGFFDTMAGETLNKAFHVLMMSSFCTSTFLKQCLSWRNPPDFLMLLLLRGSPRDILITQQCAHLILRRVHKLQACAQRRLHLFRSKSRPVGFERSRQRINRQ